MRCPSCGTTALEGEEFCQNCGKKLTLLKIVPQIKPQNVPSASKEMPPPPPPPPLPPQNIQAPEETKKPKKKKKWLVPVVIAGTLSILLLGGAAVFLVFFFGHSVPVSMNDYLKVDFEGYDGYGTASVEVDKERFIADYQEQLRWKRKSETEMTPAEFILKSVVPELKAGDTLENGGTVRVNWHVPADIPEVINCEIQAEGITKTVRGLEPVGSFDPFEGMEIRYEGFSSFGRIVSAAVAGKAAETGLKLTDAWSEYENLDNGDEVTFHLDFDESGKDSFIRTYGTFPSALEKKLTVQGLSELTAFDPFEGVKLLFEGEDGSGYLSSIDTESVNDICRDFSYSADRTEGLTNGDTVTVSFTADEEKLALLAEKDGKVPSASEKTFTVSGLPGYYKSLSDIPAEELERFSAEFIDREHEKYTDAPKVEKGYVLQEYVCVGFTLLVRDTEDAENDNLLYAFFKMTIKTDVDGVQVIYIPILVKNVTYDNEGKCLLVFDPNNAWYGTSERVVVRGGGNTFIRVWGTRDFNSISKFLLPEGNKLNTGMKEAGSTLAEG